MHHFQQFAKHLIPTRTQTVYCIIAAALISLYWCRDRLLSVLLSGTSASGSELHASFAQSLDRATNNSAISFLSLAVFWALLGLVVLALLYESLNVVIAARNNYTIATTYTNAKTFERNIVKSFLIKVALAVGFIIVLLVFWKLFGLWQQLIAQPAHIFFRPSSIGKELLGFIALTINLYVGWMWLLFMLVPQFFNRDQ